MRRLSSRNLKRTTNLNELLTDHSINIRVHDSFCDWIEFQNYYNGVTAMPLDRRKKMLLHSELWASLELAVLELRNPEIYVYRWSNDELRWFLVSNGGFLVEPESNAAWDECFPFLESDTRNIVSLKGDCSIRCSIGATLLWNPLTSNYTHYLFDTLAGFLYAKDRLSKNMLSGMKLPVSREVPDWQLEILGHLRLGCSTINIDALLPERNRLHCIQPEAVYLPFVRHKGVAFTMLKRWFNRMRPATAPKATRSSNVILSTRSDYRIKRIRNILELESLIRVKKGLIIDPARLSFIDKMVVFGGATHVIGESAGALNGALFGPRQCKVISLTDPGLLIDERFIPGGWAYHLGYAHKCAYIIGRGAMPLSGSPLASCEYPLEDIVHALDKEGA